jgi:tetratricopeptide (TPR) repeat protein
LAPAADAASIRALLRQQQFSAGLQAAQGLLAVVPEHRDALLYAAIAQRYLGRIPDALSTLEILERQHPRFSRLHEERGQCFVALKQASPAIESFLRAVNINNALPASWRQPMWRPCASCRRKWSRPPACSWMGTWTLPSR